MPIESSLETKERQLTKHNFKSLYKRYYDELLQNIIPFWLKHSLDQERGGYWNCLDRDGSIWDTDKYLWMQGRELWMWSVLYQRIERKREWEEAATLGAEFLRRYGLNKEGRVHFAVTREGYPLLKPRDIYAESFVAIGMAAYGNLMNASWATELALRTYQVYLNHADLPETHDATQYIGARPVRMHGISFIRVSMSQAMREFIRDPRFDQQIEQGINDILQLHVRGKTLFEYVGFDGGSIPGPMGRLLIPGHAVESAAFILSEGKYRGRKDWIERAADIIEYSLEVGWDQEYGGIFYFIDHERIQNRESEWDMKLWWVHVEALYATLLGWRLTGRSVLLDWFFKIDEWVWSHFPDPQYGEWFGYLRRDGQVSMPLKGSMWKCFFHLPRSLFGITELLKEDQPYRTTEEHRNVS